MYFSKYDMHRRRILYMCLEPVNKIEMISVKIAAVSTFFFDRYNTRVDDLITVIGRKLMPEFRR